MPKCAVIPTIYILALGPALLGAPPEISFSPPAAAVEAYDFVDLAIHIASPAIANPFTGAVVRGWFEKADGSKRTEVDGFCDSPDGSLFRIRFMPSSAGDYRYSVTYRQDSFEKTNTGTFQATASHRRGPLRVDQQYPWHFIWEGTGEHYFFNGTTAFWLVGWKEDRVIDYTIDRLVGLKINRLRVLLAGAANMFWGEPVMLGDNFTYFLRPWVAKEPQNFNSPGIDYSRFNIPYWQKWERMLRYARERDMIISVIQDISTHKAQPQEYSDDERRYLRYMVARLSAFSNITYDLGDDMDSFRDEKWVHATGTLIEGWDPYKHLATSHPVRRPQHPLMLEEREIQKKTGRIIPQTNEEYGYEDHYPHWAPGPGSDSPETLRHMAWEIAMAGAYGTAGESSRRGTNIWPDTGGGWINGRGDDTQSMLKGYGHMVEFFTSFEWWKTEPHDELVDQGAFCLAQPGEIYAVYLPKEGKVTVKLTPGAYRAAWFSAFTGERIPLPPVQGPSWTSPQTPGWLDWALLLERQR